MGTVPVINFAMMRDIARDRKAPPKPQTAQNAARVAQSKPWALRRGVRPSTLSKTERVKTMRIFTIPNRNILLTMPDLF